MNKPLKDQPKATRAAAVAVAACNEAIIRSTAGRLPKWAITAKPYLRAIRDNNYGLEDPEMCVLYALNNLASWRGEEARNVKQLLNEAIK